MINNGQGGCGNDLAIDDIEFKSCGDTVTVSDSSNNNVQSLCSTQTPFISTLTASPDFAVYSSHFYQWQESTDLGNTWSDITGQTNPTLPISISSSTYYRSKIAEVAVNLTNPQCVSFSNEYRVTVNQLPPMPTLACWETATININECSWDITGEQPVMPVGLQCWEIAVFNNITCLWEITGSQPVQPTIACWQTTTFNTSNCIWEVAGSQAIEPTLECWETAMFNNTVCSWEVIGIQPVQPVLECWETTNFNTTTCLWEVSGMQPGNVYEENLELCENEFLTLIAQTNITNPTFIWSTGNTTKDIIIDASGTYIVDISGGVCAFETIIFNVTLLDLPIIDNIISNGNDIIISPSNSGDFLYSIDGSFFQPNNIFYDVDGGFYTIYVKQVNCSNIVMSPYLHFYIPKFFTPNNDGVNDTFSLTGIEFYSTSQVSIFNRYGKLLKTSRNTRFTWDGTAAGQLSPSDDYWYVIIIEDQKFTGHFTLKR